MDNFVDKRDFALLEQDKCPYFILRRLLDGEYEWVLSDHARIIVCKSGDGYPIWIWTIENASLGVIEWAYRIIAEHDLFRWHRLNVKYPLVEYFKEHSAANGRKIYVHANLLAYECQTLIAPEERAEGALYRCDTEDIDALASMMKGFREERRDRKRNIRSEAENAIAAGNVFFWKDKRGRAVSCCKYTVAAGMACLSLVYTKPEFRRQHYAQTLAYEVSKLATEAGYIPMLYADADYDPANACYEKLGYTIRGKVYTIAEF